MRFLANPEYFRKEHQSIKPPENNKKKQSLREVYEWIDAVIAAIIVLVLLFTFVFRIAGVDGESMMDTLNDNDRVVLFKAFYTPKQGDIVVITQPNFMHKPLIKRIIATEGQTVGINFETGAVFVDGVELYEPYIKELTKHCEDVEFPLEILPGYVFVMGDNRMKSMDSRDSRIGLIETHYILGKAILRVYPFTGIKFFSNPF